jgi:hypothetical protein
MLTGTASLPSGILGNDKMFDPTQTQPLSWRMHQGKPTPWEEVPIDPPNRQDPSLDNAPPDRLSERGYRLRARIGHGRLGAVYEAQDELSRVSGSRHFAAVTLIDPRIASRQGFAADFEPGAAELQSIAHPNIVKLLEYGRERGHFYLVNELLESASLRFVLNDVGALPAGEANAVLRPVGDALQYLHAKDIVHGDLRPENVLVTFGYDVKLLDIVPTGWLVNPPDALGVPARAPDKRDDVFGLACLAYEMLAGRHPYNGNTAQEAYRAGLEPARIDNMSDRQWRALASALAVHRDDRTPSVALFLEEFGVSPAEQLRTVVAGTNEARDPGVAQAAAQLEGAAPAVAPRVVAIRSKRAESARSSGLRTLFLLLALIALGAAAWYYRDPLVAFGTELIATVETEMDRIRATEERPAATAADAPLTQAPAVLDDTPATVVADGSGRTVVTETAPPGIPALEAPAPAPRDKAPAAAVPAPAQQAPAKVAPEPADSAPVETAPLKAAPVEAAPTAAAAGPVRFAFERDALSVREGDVAARIVIRRSGDLSGTAEVSWSTADGTAVADRDYADLGARLERFQPGESSRTIYVPLSNDSVPETARSFRVLLEGGAAIRVDILDDD